MIELRERTPRHVEIYFEKTRDGEIQRLLPSAAATVEEALDMFRAAQSPHATSFGQTVYWDGQYVGDIWCYGIDPADTPNAMVSYCIFEKALWGRGIATQALAQFLPLIRKKFALGSVGAFTYADNAPSIAVLERNGFRRVEEFTEDGRKSVYLEWQE